MKLNPGIRDVELEEEAVKISRLKRIAFYTFRARIGTQYLLRKNKLHLSFERFSLNDKLQLQKSLEHEHQGWSLRSI